MDASRWHRCIASGSLSSCPFHSEGRSVLEDDDDGHPFQFWSLRGVEEGIKGLGDKMQGNKANRHQQ